MYSPFRDRLLINYCQFLVEEALLLRDSGAPFIGDGEKYWSLVDDPEIEILKALWEGPDYLRIPMARRICNLDIGATRDFFYSKAEQIASECALFASQTGVWDISVYNFRRGVWLMAVAQVKRFDSIRVRGEYYKFAKEAFLTYAGKNRDIFYLTTKVIKWEGKEL